MKQIKTLLIATFLFIGASQSISAQSKIAHVDTNELISKMPAMIEAQKQLENLSKQYDAEFKTMADEYYAKLKKYDEESSTVTAKVNEDRAKEVQDMEKRIRDYRETAQKELQKKESDLAKPLMDKIKASIAKVGKTKGFNYVIDVNSAIFADGTDLTSDVKKDLGF
jgi:outer membrane protein